MTFQEKIGDMIRLSVTGSAPFLADGVEVPG